MNDWGMKKRHKDERAQNPAISESEPEAGRSVFAAKSKAWELASRSLSLDVERQYQTERDIQAALQKLFGKNLARIRTNAGYSQLALSIEVDLTHNFINELEQGKKGASFATLSRLSTVLRTPVAQFFEASDEDSLPDNFRYPDSIDKMVTELHEMIDGWNDKRTK
jgi:transcriptional regulator with XRE-family HTH domain